MASSFECRPYLSAEPKKHPAGHSKIIEEKLFCSRSHATFQQADELSTELLWNLRAT
jgi:hypothetical protein